MPSSENLYSPDVAIIIAIYVSALLLS